MGQIPRQRLETTRRAIDVFLLSKQLDGSIRGLGYWQTANGYTAIALHDLWAGSLHYKSLVESALSAIESAQPGFINEFNDDSMWWALASIAAYHAYGHNKVHLERAKQIHRHVANSVVERGQYEVHGMDMEGGVFWTTRPDEQNLNAITTGLFAELSGELAVLEASEGNDDTRRSLQKHFHPIRTSKPLTRKKIHRSLCETALYSLEWIRRCRLSDSIIKDTIKVRDQELIDWIFTYNSGQCIGACVAIAKSFEEGSSHRDELLRCACHLAEAAMNLPYWHDADGILTEAHAYGPQNHEAHENDDAVGFKSILVRNLGKLYKELTRLTPDDPSCFFGTIRLHLQDYFILQFNSLQTVNVNEISQYGPWWAGPFDMPTSHAQMAILDVMAVIHLVEDDVRHKPQRIQIS